MTVDEIAERDGLPSSEVDQREAKAAVIHGDELKDFSSEDLDEILELVLLYLELELKKCLIIINILCCLSNTVK
jgi:hypothetical protein